MKKGWKIALVSLGSLLALAVAAVAVALWLVFTPSQLTRIVNSLASKYVKAETRFESVDLTLFRTFPDAGLKIGRVYVVNPMEGAPGDTVASIGSLTVGVDVKKFLKEKEVVVHEVLLDRVEANLYIDREGNSNFDIFPTSGDEDTASTAFSLDSLPGMDLNKIRVSRLNARLLDLRDGLEAGIGGLGLSVDGTLKEGRVDARVELDGETVAVAMTDSAGNSTLDAALERISLALKGKGNLDEVEGKLKLAVKGGSLKAGGADMVNETLQRSGNDLLTLDLPFAADLRKMLVALEESRLGVDDYGLLLSGSVQLATDSLPMAVDVATRTDGTWQVAPLLELLPPQFAGWKKGMDVDGKVRLEATAKGAMADGAMPLVEAQVQLGEGFFYMPASLPYRVSRIAADIAASLDLGKEGAGSVDIRSLTAHTRGTDVKVAGRVDDLTGDMRVDATVRAKLPLEDAMDMVPDSLPLKAEGKADIDVRTRFRMSQIEKMDLEHVVLSGRIGVEGLDVVYDSIAATAPSLDIALAMPAKEHVGKMADASVRSSGLKVSMNGVNATVDKPDINIGINNPLKEQVSASFDIKVGETEANVDSMMVSVEGLSAKGSVRLDSAESNLLRQYSPEVDVDMHGAVLYMPDLPDAVRLSQLGLAYGKGGGVLRTAEVKLGHSDFRLNGTVDNLEQWMDHKGVLKADLNFTSGYADVDQLLALVSGIGTDADTLAKMREEDNVPADANPFIVPKDVEVTLNTHIKRSIAFGNDLNDVAGAVTVKNGKAVLDQIGFVCKAATMQLTAIYESPRPNNLFVALDFHLLDIQIDELLNMIPTMDTLVPMLAAFNGNANFHLAAETYLNARYEPKMSTLLGAAAVSGRDLTVMDNSSIAQIAKLMQFKSWKDKDNKIKIDSLDVELTCFRKVIEVYPFLLNIGKYSVCASGKHSLDNQCGYHVELLKNPLLAKVGVDVKGDLSKPKISLGEVKYADLYRPGKQGVVEKQTLELKRMVREALEATVR